MKASGQIHTPAALNPGKILRYPLERKLGGATVIIGPQWKREKSHVAAVYRVVCRPFKALVEVHLCCSNNYQ